MTTALVIGAGVAGPVAALALQRAGLEVRLFEAHERGADEIGSWLVLQANGIDALAAIGVDGLVAGLGYPTSSMRFISGRGKVLGRMPNGAPPGQGVPSQLIRRADLYRGLRDEAQARGVEVLYGKAFVDAPIADGRVMARFADGTTAEGDLLIGCDGIQSTVRRVIDPQAAPVRYVPVLNIGGYIPGFTVDTAPEEFQMMFGKRCYFGWSAVPGGTVWFANPPRTAEPAAGELAGMTDQQWRSWLLELFADDAGPAREIVAAAPAPLTGWATYDLPSVRHWHRDRLVIIGDAAHATSPSAGQGASMALEDAVILAQCVRDLPDPQTAFAAFEQRRRARVERIVAFGARSSNSKAAGPVGRIIRDALLPLILARLSRNDGAALNWIHGHHIDWDASVAPLPTASTSPTTSTPKS